MVELVNVYRCKYCGRSYDSFGAKRKCFWHEKSHAFPKKITKCEYEYKNDSLTYPRTISIKMSDGKVLKYINYNEPSADERIPFRHYLEGDYYYKCSICGNRFSTFEEASSCEARHPHLDIKTCETKFNNYYPSKIFFDGMCYTLWETI